MHNGQMLDYRITIRNPPKDAVEEWVQNHCLCYSFYGLTELTVHPELYDWTHLLHLYNLQGTVVKNQQKMKQVDNLLLENDATKPKLS